MQTVYLKGNLSKFGEVWHTNCTSIANIFKLIECQSPKFREHLISSAESGCGLKIVKGSEIIEDIQELGIEGIKETDIYITEIPAGATKNKYVNIAIGVALMVIAAPYAFGAQAAVPGAFSWATVGFNVGLSLTLSGISQILMKPPSLDDPTDNSPPQDKYFNGPENSAVKQGVPVPLLYGELLVGGAVINQNFVVDEALAGVEGLGFDKPEFRSDTFVSLGSLI